MNRTIYLAAHGSSPYEPEAPSFAMFVYTPGFMEQLLKLQGLCKEHKLSEARIAMSPDSWGGCDEESLSLFCGELVCTPREFYFADTIDDSGCHIETSAVSIDELVDAVNQANAGTDIYLSPEPDALRELVESY